MSGVDPGEALPIVPHLAGEFYAWLWWESEQRGAVFALGPPAGAVDVWVEDRLAFRSPDETRITAVMTGENPAATLEARAALAGGKVLQEIRLGIRRDDREYAVTLKGASMHVAALRLPQVVTTGGDEVLMERVHLYEELCLVLQGLLTAFARARSEPTWQQKVLPALNEWVLGADGGLPSG
jgi:hypothetical protein